MGIPEAAPGQRHTGRDAGTTQLGPCLRIPWLVRYQYQGLQGTVEPLVVHIANKQRDIFGKSKVSISEVHSFTTKPWWDPKE